MKKLVSYSVSGRDLNQNQRKCRECFSFTPRALLQLLYKLWITTIAKYILIQLKNICGKTFVTKVERRLIVEIKRTITFAKSFIWFCVPSNTTPEFPNFIGLETILSDSKHHLRVTVCKTLGYQWGEGFWSAGPYIYSNRLFKKNERPVKDRNQKGDLTT